MNKLCYYEGLEIDIMQSFFKLFITQAQCVQLQLGVFVLFFICFIVFQSSRVQPPSCMQYFAFLLSLGVSIFCVFCLQQWIEIMAPILPLDFKFILFFIGLGSNILIPSPIPTSNVSQCTSMIGSSSPSSNPIEYGLKTN